MDSKKPSQDWLREPQYLRVTIIDPDGWDRRNFSDSWNEEITETEFRARLMMSSVIWRPAHSMENNDG